MRDPEMNDLDRRLRESLTQVRDSYEEERRDSRLEARVRFIERYRRRRMVFRVGTVALAGAAIVGIAVFATTGLDPFSEGPSDVAGDLPRGVIAAIETGDDPVDTGIRMGGVWVANAGDNTLTNVVPATNDVEATIELEGSPQEVDAGEGGIWVAGFGRVTAFNTETNERINSVEVGDESDTITLSVGEGAVWVVVDESRLLKLDPTSFTLEEIPAASAPVDVAARDGSVWVVDSEQGLLQLDPVTGQPRGEPIEEVNQGDVSGGQGVVWIGDPTDNTVTRFDATTREFEGNVNVRGTYIDMAVSATTIWVLSNPDGQVLLTAVNPDNRRPIGKPLKLIGDPVEVSAGSGGVWVVARDLDAVLRIDPAAITR